MKDESVSAPPQEETGSGPTPEPDPEPDPSAERIRRLEEDLLKSKERMLRVAADFENFRKRTKKDTAEAEQRARVSILKEILPVFDNLSRAVEHGSSLKDPEPIFEGARMVTRQFEENLAKFGLRRIESLGKVFDPGMHDAIAQEESEECPPGTVIREFLAGYTLEDRLLRPAMVVVAKPKK